MSLTQPRTMSPAWGIKLSPSPSPSPSPFTNNSKTPLRSPSKRPDINLALRQVIGTTTNSANAFDSLPSARSLVYCAGAAVVVAVVDDDHGISQRYLRARPASNPINPSSSVYGSPSTPTQNESRNRSAASLRDSSIAVSPLASPANDWGDSPSNKTWSTRDRIKAATCVSFSPDGKFLAVGETGYKPRVLIFSTSPDGPSDTPLTALGEHTFGVKCIAFSPDSQYLASLGCANDGFIYVWSINPRNGAATLHSSNKCTSNINRIAWMGSNLVTVGTRHVKVWRIEDANTTPRLSKTRQSELSFPASTHKTLSGRNCLLESLLDANFTSVVAVSPSRAIVASDKGHVCLIDDDDGTQRFSQIADAGMPVTSLAVDAKGRLHLASSQGGLKTLNITQFIEAPTPPLSPHSWADSPAVTLSADDVKIEAVASLADYIVTVDSEHSIRLCRLCASDDEDLIGEVVQVLPAHGSPVLGVTSLDRPNSVDASFCTWSAGGLVLFWNYDGMCKKTIRVPLEQLEGDAELNELKTVHPSKDASFLVAGDKYGILRILDCKTHSSAFDFKAHANEITNVAIFEAETSYIATSARDRMVQVFQRKTDGSWDLMQTLDEHVGAVTGVLFSQSGDRLVSMSSDRSIVVRELASQEAESGPLTAFLILRTIILKATPVSIAWDAEQDHVLLVSTIDRQVHKYDVRSSSHCLSSFRASDSDGGDAVVLSSLVHIPRGWGSPLVAGVSSTDKSVRLYEENGTLLARDWGHTEGVTSIALVQSGVDDDNTERSLVTVAVDGTIFLWGLQLSRHEMSKSMDLLGLDTPSNQALLASKPPLRRVLSQSELAKFQRSPEEDYPTPTGSRSPKLRKKTSKFSLASAPKLEPSPVPKPSRDRLTSKSSHSSLRRSNRNTRSPSPTPPSPRNPQLSSRRSSVDVRLRNSKASYSEFGSLGALTESLNRTLRAYRKRLNSSNDTLSAELVREVERELALTTRAVGEKAKSNGAFDEGAVQRLLDQYSEKILSALDEKIAASVASRVRENSCCEGAGVTTPTLLSPTFAPPGMEAEESKVSEKEKDGGEGHITDQADASITKGIVES